MELTRRRLAALLSLSAAAPALACTMTVPRPLPSWKDGPARRALLDFVAKVTTEGPEFVPPHRRIATFDNDGTLWVEKPIYTEALFLFDRARDLAAADPALAAKPAYKAILSRDHAKLASLGEADILGLVNDTHAGMTAEAFSKTASDWIAKRKDPRFGRLFSELVYQPQLELLAFLRMYRFTPFIVSGGGVDFMRTFAASAYGIAPHQVVGSSGKLAFEMRGDRGFVFKQPGVGAIDDKAGKPVNIDLHIGQRPILAFGNSDGDLQMLQYAATGYGPRLALLLHHDDAVREYAYDRDSSVGHLDVALDEAGRRGWTVVSMKRDWKTIFPFESSAESGAGTGSRHSPV
jgi:hypothetical protein